MGFMGVSERENSEKNEKFIKETIWNYFPKWNGGMSLKIKNILPSSKQSKWQNTCISHLTTCWKISPYWGGKRR